MASQLQMDASSSLSYEEARRQRLEENQRRMQELGLASLSKNLINDVIAAKTPLGKSQNARHLKLRGSKDSTASELRRSSRVASNPSPDYREVDSFDSLGRRSYSSRASSLLNRKYASDEARLDAILHAETIMKELPLSNPSFVKPMLQSHVTGGFWLGLPSSFCKNHLPKKDEKIVLENEKGEEWDCVYLGNKSGLSGGWRGFSLDHGLVDGDALVFELIEPCRFKVHIVRGSEPENAETFEPHLKTENIGEKAGVLKDIKTDDVEEVAVAKNGKGKKQEWIKVDDDEERSRKNASPSKESKKRKRKEKDEDIDDLFEVKEENNEITSYLRTRKALSSARVSKKAMSSCSSGIQVC